MSDLDWPAGFPRTPIDERTAYPHHFRVSRSEAFDNIVEELRLMDVDDFRVETAAPHTAQAPHRPYNDQHPEDTGVVVYFDRGDEHFAVPCDRWNSLRDNAQAIAKYLDAKRALDRYGVATIRDEFSASALPEGSEAMDQSPHDVLGVSPDAPQAVIEAAARELKKEYHPDRGGDRDQFMRIVSAERELLAGGKP